MNRIQIMGRLGADPEVRFTQNGKKIINFNVATNSRKGGKDETHWWRVTIWENTVNNLEAMMPYIKKGSAIIVYGELRPSMYTDREGKQAMSLDVTADSVSFNPFGSSNPDRANQEGGQQQQQQAAGAPAGGFAEQRQPYGAASGAQYGQNTQQQPASRSYAEEEPLPF